MKPLSLLAIALTLAVGVLAQTPGNDNFANAQVLTSTSNVFTATGSNAAATSEPDEPVHATAYTAVSSIWFAWTAPANGAIVVDTIGSATTASHAIYTGTSLATLTRVATDFTSSLSAFDKVPVSVTGGVTYYIAVGSRFDQGDRGPIVLHLTFSTGPSITTQPTDCTANPGDSVSFAVTAAGPGIAYQWFRNGIALASGTTATLAIANVQTSDGGRYHVAVSNAAGTVISATGVLRGTNPVPIITAQPENRLATAGETTVLSVTATGAGPLQYQWRRNGLALTGATLATLTFAPVSRSDIDVYDVRVNDGLSVVYSSRIRLDVQPAANPQGLGIDPAFNIAFETEGGAVAKVRRAPDGKIFVAGNFARYDGAAKPNLARLNADGSLDATFAGANFDAPISDVVVQDDGKLIVLGTFTLIDGLARSSVARLNADGSPDASFSAAPTFSIRSFTSVTLQADGKILIAGDFTASYGGIARSNLLRLLADGTLDIAYNPNPAAAVRSVALLSDGKLLVAGAFTSIGGAARPYLTRLNADGTNDANFNSGTGPNGTTNVVKLASDGRVLISGAISQFNGAAAPGLLRLNADGTRDSSFVGANATGGSISDLALLADGRFIIVGSFQDLNDSFALSGSYGLARLKVDGSPDNTFTTDAPIAGGIASVLALDDGRVLVGGNLGKFTFAQQLGGVAAYFATGKRDPAVRGTLVTGSVSALSPLPGGKFLVAGDFSRVNGAACAAVVRINADGSLDPTFTASPNDSVSDAAVQGDGKIVITGAFTSVAGSARNGFARLNRDGSLDTAFNVNDMTTASTGAGLRVTALAEGRVLLAGNVLSSYILNRRNFARFHADGSLDAGFVPFTGSSVGSFIFSGFAVLPDERVFYANDGAVSSGGVKAPVLGRLLTDGRVDATFTPGTTAILGGGVNTVVPLPDGKTLIGGSFTTYSNITRNRLARLLPDGAVDPAFVPNVATSNSIARLLPARDGAIYVFRSGATFGSQAPLATAFTRFTPTAELDASFVLAFTATSTALSPALLLDDGNLLLAGGTFREGSVTRTGLMRTRALNGVFILTQPASTSLTAGANLTLSVTAGGASSFTYQWFKDGVAIDGAESATYSIARAQGVAAGSYFVRIAYEGGTVDSTPATLTVTESAPVMSGAPIGLGTTMQAGTRFALVAPTLTAGSTPLSYQWSKNGVALAGETGSALFRAAWLEEDTGDYRVSVTNSLGSVTSEPLFQSVTNSAHWNWVSPLPQGNSLGFVQYLNGIFLAGGRRGTILCSTDGVAWTLHRVGGSADVGPFAFGNGVYVALTNFGGVLTSPDGATWTRRESGLNDGRPLTQIAFAAGRFVAVGSRGTILSSVNGVEWTPASVAVSDDFIGIAYGAGKWLAVSTRSRAYTSSDGLVWTAGSVLPDTMRALAFGSGVFAATSASGVSAAYSSPDGVNWARHPYAVSSTGSTVSLQYTSAGFLAPLNSSTGRYLISTDGVSWIERSQSAFLSNIPLSVTYGAGRFVMVGNAPEVLLTSVDGTVWTHPGNAESRAFRAVVAKGDILVAVGVGVPGIGTATSGLVYRSTDGAAWQPQTIGTTATLNDVAGGSHGYVAVGASGTILSSPTGELWTQRTSGTSATLRGVSLLGNHYYTVGDNGVMLTSADGAAWDSIETGTTQALYRIAAGGGASTIRYVAVGAGGTVLAAFADQSWMRLSSGTSATLIDLVYAKDKWVAIGSTGEVITSTDGGTWNLQTTLPTALTGLSFAGQQFIAMGAGSTYFVSPDGAIWTTRQHGSANPLNDAVEYKSRLVAVGNSGSILSVSLPQITSITPFLSIPVDGTATLSVSATGDGPFTYQWFKHGVAIAGATSMTLSLRNVKVGAADTYQVVVSNGAGGAITQTLVLVGVNLADFAAAHSASNAEYRPGGMVTITNTLTYSGTLSTFGWEVTLPDGWAFASNGLDAPDISPKAGEASVLGWGWITPPASPITFSYTLDVPASVRGDQSLASLITLIANGGNAFQILARPDPLVLHPARHAADFDGDDRLSLSELLRVIELYNCRNGTVRTGAYAVDATNAEDGFVSDAARSDTTVVTLTRYHSADENHDGQLSLSDLLRVIEIYNYRSGTVRTGQYHVQSGTEDGFAPGP